MRMALWPDCSLEKHKKEMQEICKNLPEKPVFVAVREDGQLCGFLEASLHEHADGCETSPVGYIEGWYIEVDARRNGAGRTLVQMAEAWAALNGCQEMASDCLIDNRTSMAVHLALGFHEAERLIHFRKSLLSPSNHRKIKK